MIEHNYEAMLVYEATEIREYIREQPWTLYLELAVLAASYLMTLFGPVA
jgi:hypothetical protein